MKKKLVEFVRCPKRAKKECRATVKDCDHSGKHKKNSWCVVPDEFDKKCSCPPCQPVEGK